MTCVQHTMTGVVKILVLSTYVNWRRFLLEDKQEKREGCLVIDVGEPQRLGGSALSVVTQNLLECNSKLCSFSDGHRCGG